MRGDGASDFNVTVLFLLPLPARHFSLDRFCFGDSLWRMIVITLTAALKKEQLTGEKTINLVYYVILRSS
jgi:hypothetical protein